MTFFLTSHDPNLNVIFIFFFFFVLQRSQIQLRIELYIRQDTSSLVVLAGVKNSPLHRSQPAHNCGTLREYCHIIAGVLVFTGC